MKLMSFAAAIGLTIVALNASAQSESRSRRPHHEPPTEVKAAMDACLSENGISINREAGERPTEEQRKTLDTCMAEKGFEPPQGPPPHGPRGNRSQQQSSQSSNGGIQ